MPILCSQSIKCWNNSSNCFGMNTGFPLDGFASSFSSISFSAILDRFVSLFTNRYSVNT